VISQSLGLNDLTWRDSVLIYISPLSWPHPRRSDCKACPRALGQTLVGKGRMQQVALESPAPDGGDLFRRVWQWEAVHPSKH